MRKQLIRNATGAKVPGAELWLDLETLATVEVTSEDREHPIEHALVSPEGSGWRAAEPGPQLIRLVFDQPQDVKRIHIAFQESAVERTQEFALRWSPEPDSKSTREIVRQQWNFNPGGSTAQLEDYGVNLSGVRVLELNIVPNISGGEDRASLAALRVA